MARKNLTPYEGPPLKLNLGIGSDRDQLLVHPISNDLTQKCNYCGITCANLEGLKRPLFYTVPIRIKGELKIATACAFCAQVKYMNIVGVGKGEIYICDYISQNNIMMLWVTAKAGQHLARQATETMAKNPEQLEGEGHAHLKQWIEVGIQCSTKLASLKGVFSKDLIAFNRQAQPASEQQNLVTYLSQLTSEQYADAIKKINSKFICIPRETNANMQIVEYFAEHWLQNKYPMDQWKKIATFSENRKKSN